PPFEDAAVGPTKKTGLSAIRTIFKGLSDLDIGTEIRLHFGSGMIPPLNEPTFVGYHMPEQAHELRLWSPNNGEKQSRLLSQHAGVFQSIRQMKMPADDRLAQVPYAPCALCGSCSKLLRVLTDELLTWSVVLIDPITDRCAGGLRQM